MTFRQKFTLLASLVGLMVPAASQAEWVSRPLMPVVELFTSQGCSSCPPADKLLHELADQGDVLALTLPVDYWDYLGWKDTLASPVNTNRQKSYAHSFKLRSIYTPQMVIDGTHQVVGSRREDVLNAIEDRRGFPYPALVRMRRAGDALDIRIKGDVEGTESTVWLLQIDHEQTVPIQRGENGGRTITYRNVVRDIAPIGMWDGQDATLQLPFVEVENAGHDATAVLVQQKATGRIIGAAYIDVLQTISMDEGQ